MLLDVEAGTEFINGEENGSRVLHDRLRIDINHYHGDAVDIPTRSSMTFHSVLYSLNEELNQSYINSTVDLEAYWHPTDNWSFESSLLYRIFDRNLFGVGQDIALLNLSLSRLLFAGLGNLQFAFSDVLNRSQGVTITNGATYFEEARVVSLCRNAMLNFTYKLPLMKRRRYAPYLNRAAGIVGCTWRNSNVCAMLWTVNPVHGHDIVVEPGGVHFAPSRARIGSLSDDLQDSSINGAGAQMTTCPWSRA